MIDFVTWIENQEKFEPLYYGCSNNNTGHYVFTAEGGNIYSLSHSEKTNNSNFLASNDAKLTPIDSYKQGRAIFHIYPTFTILAFWDNSVDSRPGSNSMFMLPPGTTSANAIDTARKIFSSVFQRFKFPVEIIKTEHH